MVALVRGVHGLHGRVRVEVLTDRPEVRFAPGTVLHPEGTRRVLTISLAEAVADGPGWWLAFREVTDRGAAEALPGIYLEAVVDSDELPEGDVYWHEVIGVAVASTEGAPLGRVEDVYRAGGAEVLVVRGGPLGELDVPNVGAVVREFAPREGRIVVDLASLDLDATPAPRRPRGRRTRRAHDAAKSAASGGAGDTSAGSAGADDDGARP